jgi:proteasome lid subunit RPN8/RPN11/predicted GIY-YIG superfamily endonuclease
MSFWAYMLRCRGGVLYTGHTDDLENRIGEHQSGLVNGFTNKLLPVELVWSQEFSTRYEALTAERQIKGWSRKKKLALIRGDWAEISDLAKSKNGPSTGSGRTEVGVARQALQALLEHARRDHPHEACGLLFGEEGRIAEARPCANVAAQPERSFEIDPQALIDAHRAERGGEPKLVGYYHSHPAGPLEPSATDREHATGDGRVWAIAARGEVRLWRDGDDGFEPLSYALIDG